MSFAFYVLSREEKVLILHYFIKIPKLPYEVHHQWNAVQIVRYVVKEGQSINAEIPILIVENWWAEMEILADGRRVLAKNIFDSRLCSGGYVQVGEPIALVLCHAEDAPRSKSNSIIRVLKIEREKPKKR